MSKLETVRGLNDSAPQLQIVESVRALQQTLGQLQQTVALMHQDMGRLPNAVARETAQALTPLSTLAGRLDEVLSIQRQAVDELVDELVTKAGESFQQSTGQLRAAVSSADGQVQTLSRAALDAVVTSGKLTAAFETGGQVLLDRAREVNEEAEKLKAQTLPWWGWALVALLPGLVAGGVVRLGMPDSSGPAQSVQQCDAATMQNATFGEAVWSRATPAEQQSLKRIANRPAK